MPILAQTLHGYDQGHRLLASGGDLDSRELSLLDRLSDLSGYLPTGTQFDFYLTGFPCGRYYAFACTWLDLAATRAGTVLTHTVLIPRGDAGFLDDPWRLRSLHRRPQGANDRERYREVISIPELPEAPSFSLGAEERAAATVLLLGTSERPILWVDEHPPEATVRFLWRLLRPEQRLRFSFCTFALQPRSVEGQVFEFLGLPPSARGSFLERASSEAWWDSGHLLHSRMAALTQQPWALEIAREGAAPLRRIESVCQTQDLRVPPPKDFTTLWRFMSLEPAASERLAAARARVDLFERLWPEVTSEHPAVAPLLQALLVRQVDAAVEPRPLWELTDFFNRTLVKGRLATDSQFALEVDQVLVRELGRRFERAPERTAQELPALLNSMTSRGDTPLLETLRRVLTAQSESSMRLASAFLRTSADSRWPELMDTTLAALPVVARRQAFDAAIEGMNEPLQKECMRLADESAKRLDDIPLRLSLAKMAGRELEVLRSVIQGLLSRGGDTIESRLSSVLAEVTASVRFEWSLDEAMDPTHDGFAAREGAQAARALGLETSTLVQRCAGHRNGARVLFLFVKESTPAEPFAQALRSAPGLALELAVLSLREEGHGTDGLMRMAAECIPPEQLLAPSLFQALISTRDPGRTRDLVDRLGPQWVLTLCEDTASLEEVAKWLVLPRLRQWLQITSRSGLLARTPPEDAERLLPQLALVLDAWLEASTTYYDTAWIRSVLKNLIPTASIQAFNNACPPLSDTLKRVPSMLYDDALMNDLLVRVENTHCTSGWRIVELVFPRYYAWACREEKSWRNAFTSLLTGKDWDKAKPVRHWLLRIYLQCDWPPESFLRALNKDTSLFFRLVYRAAKSPEGMDFLRRLPLALEADPALVSHWRRPIEEALANPQRAVDFE